MTIMRGVSMSEGAGMELVKQWVKVIFAILLGFAFIYVLNSVFLAIMVWTFLFFIPSADKDTETAFSQGVFTFGMILLIVLAFFQTETLGLGLEINLSNTLFGSEGLGSGIGAGIGVLFVLAFLALLAVKGITSFAPTKGASEPQTLEWMLTVGIYFFLIATAIILKFWEWNASTIIFIGIWTMAYISGSAGDQDSRQAIGVIMIVTSFVIFSLGIGTQLVGAAFFGQWWPTMYQGIAAFTEPFGEVFSGISQAFSGALCILTNPVGCAQQIVNGTFNKDPVTGLSGPLGLELAELSLTPIYVSTPYSAVIKVQNKGAFVAENVKLTLKLGDKSPTGTLRDIGFPAAICSPTACIEEGDDLLSISKLDLRQIFFTSDGISCASIVSNDLRKRFLPLEGTVQYDYKIDSSLEVEFISQGEFDRLVREQRLPILKKKAAQLTNAPVRLNIDTVEQPIREGTKYNIQFNLIPAKSGGKITNATIQVEFPNKMGTAFCTPKPQNAGVAKGDVTLYEWSPAQFFNNNFYLFCSFDGFDFTAAAVSGPTQTLFIRANASYRFEEKKSFPPGAIQFGGIQCCNTNADCPGSGLECTAEKICAIPSKEVLLQRVQQLRTKVDELGKKFEELKQEVNDLVELTNDLKTIIDALKVDYKSAIDSMEIIITASQQYSDDPEVKNQVENLRALQAVAQIKIDYFTYQVFFIEIEKYTTAEIEVEKSKLETTIASYSAWESNAEVSAEIQQLQDIKQKIEEYLNK